MDLIFFFVPTYARWWDHFRLDELFRVEMLPCSVSECPIHSRLLIVYTLQNSKVAHSAYNAILSLPTHITQAFKRLWHLMTPLWRWRVLIKMCIGSVCLIGRWFLRRAIIIWNHWHVLLVILLSSKTAIV